MASKRKRKGEPADPEFVAYIAEQQQRRHEAFMARQSNGRVTLDPEVRQAHSGDPTPPVSVLHRHEADCFERPPTIRRNGSGTASWDAWCSRTGQWTPVRLVMPGEHDTWSWERAETERGEREHSGAEVAAEPSWWTKLGTR